MLPANPTISEIFEHLLDGQRCTLSFHDQRTFQSIYSQLRAIKSRYDTNYAKIADDSITDGKVVRYLELSKPGDSAVKITFFLGAPKRTERIKKFSILPNPIQNNESGSADVS